jgi:hypothetical protein
MLSGGCFTSALRAGQSASSRTPGRHDTRRRFPLSCHGLSFPFAKWLKAKPPALGLDRQEEPASQPESTQPTGANEHPPVGGSTLNVMNITSVLHRPVQHRHESPNWCMSWIVQFQPLDLGMTDQNAQRS